jgi:hypothetical protein
MIGHPSETLFEEMAYLAWLVHWPHDQLMTMTHHERRRWVHELGRIAAQASDPATTGETAWP